MTETAILVEGLAKRFGQVVALDGIDFEVPAGSVFGLLGPNGAGKTTAVRVLATVIAPDGGRAEVLGHDVVREAEAVRYRIGLADRVVVVDKGRVIADDTPTALKAQLGNTVTELGMSGGQEAERAAALVARLGDVRAEREGSTLRISSEDGARVLIEVLRALDT